jgi:hypothetical protein
MTISFQDTHFLFWIPFILTLCTLLAPVNTSLLSGSCHGNNLGNWNCTFAVRPLLQINVTTTSTLHKLFIYPKAKLCNFLHINKEYYGPLILSKFNIPKMRALLLWTNLRCAARSCLILIN